MARAVWPRITDRHRAFTRAVHAGEECASVRLIQSRRRPPIRRPPSVPDRADTMTSDCIVLALTLHECQRLPRLELALSGGVC